MLIAEGKMATTGQLRAGMAVHDADGRPFGTIEQLDDAGFVAAGQRLSREAIARVEGDVAHLWAERGTYDPARSDAPTDRARNTRLPNPDAGLYLNEHPVERSLEDRLPRDGQR